MRLLALFFVVACTLLAIVNAAPSGGRAASGTHGLPHIHLNLPTRAGLFTSKQFSKELRGIREPSDTSRKLQSSYDNRVNKVVSF